MSQCPYRKNACKSCPGDEEGEKPWEPIEGFSLQDDGILCLDWDILLPLTSLPEGRHTSGLDSADKIDDAHRRYNRTPKRRVVQRKYESTEKGKKTVDKYHKTDKFRSSIQKYQYSKKGQEAKRKREEEEEKLKKALLWLKSNPGKTFSDYLREVKD